MEENENSNVKVEVKRNSNMGIIVILIIIILALGICVGYLLSKNTTTEKTTVADNTQVIEKSETTKENINVVIEYGADNMMGKKLEKFLINDKNVVDSIVKELDLRYYELILQKQFVKDNMVFVDLYVLEDGDSNADDLFIFDSNGRIIAHFGGKFLEDADYDNSYYSFLGEFNYDEYKRILTFNTVIWRGGIDMGLTTASAFEYKKINELSKAELEKFGNYAYEVKYEYKYENGKFVFVKKDAVSLIKDNEIYREYFK